MPPARAVDRAPRSLPGIGLAVTLLLACGACGGSETAPNPSDPDRPDQEPTVEGHESALEDLMALPYAGHVEDEDEDVAAVDGLITIDAERSYPGYTLLSIYSHGMALLVDHDGTVVHHWRASEPSRWEHVELMENGDILTTGTDRRTSDEEGPPPDSFSLRMTWGGEVLWKVRNRAHHELTTDPAGNLMTLTSSWRQSKEPGRKALVPGKRRVRDSLVAYLDPAGEVERSVSLLDMILAAPKEFPLATTWPTERKSVDLLHANALEWQTREELRGRGPLYGPDTVLVTMRHQDRVAIFDLAARRLVWAWGQDSISGPHDVQWLENGNLILLDNGVTALRSRVIEVDPVAREIVWEWQAPDPDDFFTKTKGSVQRLLNGNTLIGNADSGEAFEITRSGETVWRYLSPVRDEAGRRGTLHRARRYEPALIDGLIETHGANPDWQ